MAANNDVIVPDHCRESTNRKNDWKRRKTSGNECQADDIGLTRAPVTVEQRRRAFPIDIARPMYASRQPDYGFSHFVTGLSTGPRARCKCILKGLIDIAG